jgi:predicted RNA-binding Zn ribbon-like protein
MSSGNPQPASRAATLALVGCELAFDFTNTTSGQGGPRHREHLQTAEDVVIWAHHAKIIAEKSARDLRRKLARRPRLARELRQRALALRNIVHGIGVALAAGRPLRSTGVDRLTQIHAGCLRFAHLTRSRGVYVWSWESSERPVEAILGPITLSALSLLNQADLSRVKQCPGEDCGWLFFDTTKNKSRRWCEMEVCGNRAKQKRLRQRKLPR